MTNTGNLYLHLPHSTSRMYLSTQKPIFLLIGSGPGSNNGISF